MSSGVFISYAHADAEAAKELSAALDRRFIPSWMDTRDLQGGDDWRGEIVQAIASTRVFVLLLSKESVKSEQVLREAKLADDRPAAGKPKIIPVLLEAVEPEGALRHIIAGGQWIDASSGGIQAHQDQIVTTIKKAVGDVDLNSELLSRGAGSWWKSAKVAMAGVIGLVVWGAALYWGGHLLMGVVGWKWASANRAQKLAAEGARLAEAGSYTAAIGPLSEALQTNPDLMEARAWRCITLVNLERFEQALPDCNDVIGREPNSVAVLASRGVAHLRLGNFRQAFEDCHQSISLRVLSPHQFSCRGLARRALGDVAGAADDDRRAQPGGSVRK